MFVMDDVVNAVDRHDVTRFINGLSQGLPPRGFLRQLRQNSNI